MRVTIIRQRWYPTPSCLHKKNVPQCRSKLLEEQHIWRSCLKLHNYWKVIHYEINLMLEVPLEPTPECCLLHLRISKRERVLLHNLLIVQKFSLPKTRSQWWFQQYMTVYEMSVHVINE